MLGGAKINVRNFLPNLLKLIKVGVIVQKNELHKILDYFQ